MFWVNLFTRYASLQLPDTPPTPTALQLASYAPFCKMESLLTRHHDLKLLFDTLAGSSGFVQVADISEKWPKQQIQVGALPPGLFSCWLSEASADGRLSWRRFHKGIENALAALTKQRTPEETKKPAEFQWMVTSREMEEFLHSCSRENVSQALIRSRKEVYKCHKSLADQSSSRRGDVGRSPERAETRNTPKRSASFTVGQRSQLLVVNSPPPGYNEVTAALQAVKQVEQLLKEQLTGKVKLPTEGNQILQAALHLQNVLVAPPPSQANTATTGENPEAIRRQQKAAGVGVPRPMSMILPNKTQPPMISSRTFSPKKEDSQKLHQPVKVNRSVSHPTAAYLQASPSVQTPSSPVPSNRTVPSSPLLQASSRPAGSLTTDYPRMRAASSMSNLPTEARSDPKATRAMLEAWKNSRVGASKGMESNPVPLHNSSHPSGPRAVVEIPSQLPPKHQGGRHYMSSPNIHQDASNQSRISDQSAEIMRLRSEKQALIRHLFQTQGGRGYSPAPGNSALV